MRHLSDIGQVALIHHDAVEFLRQVVTTPGVLIAFVGVLHLLARLDIAVYHVLRNQVALGHVPDDALHVLSNAFALGGVAGITDDIPHLGHGQQGILHLDLWGVNITVLHAQGLEQLVGQHALQHLIMGNSYFFVSALVDEDSFSELQEAAEKTGSGNMQIVYAFAENGINIEETMKDVTVDLRSDGSTYANELESSGSFGKSATFMPEMLNTADPAEMTALSSASVSSSTGPSAALAIVAANSLAGNVVAPSEMISQGTTDRTEMSRSVVVRNNCLSFASMRTF